MIRYHVTDWKVRGRNDLHPSKLYHNTHIQRICPPYPKSQLVNLPPESLPLASSSLNPSRFSPQSLQITHKFTYNYGPYYTYSYECPIFWSRILAGHIHHHWRILWPHLQVLYQGATRASQSFVLRLNAVHSLLILKVSQNYCCYSSV